MKHLSYDIQFLIILTHTLGLSCFEDVDGVQSVVAVQTHELLGSGVSATPAAELWAN